MRALAVALLLSVPLTAGDKSSLERAVELFRSPDAGKRAAGSQLAERELRKLLAPLLKATEDDDPEVRRRARRSILSLVPGEVEKARPPTRAEIQAFLSERRAQQIRRFKALTAQARRSAAQRKQAAGLLLNGFGIHGASNRIKLQRGHVTGLRVLAVQEDSPAARLGLRKGDLILHLNGRTAVGARAVLVALEEGRAWNRVTVSVWRGGQFVRLPKK